MKGRPSLRAGYVLPTTIVLMAVVAVIVACTFAFVSNAARQTRIHLARSRCRLAAQTAIEQAKDQIWYRFYSEKIGTSSASSVKIDPKSAQIYNEWFGALDFKDTVDVNGCTVYAWASKNKIEFCERSCSHSPDHVNAGIRVLVPILATAVYVHGDGLTVTETVLEYVAFGTGQSQVFDYAYFVNNYGWMSGSGITINGDMRANGNVSLSQSTVNGFIYAAANDELGVDGTVTLSGSPRIKTQSAYRNAVGNRARPDVDDYDTNGAYDAPAGNGTLTITQKSAYSSGLVAASSGKSIVNAGASSLPMPYVSDLDSYVDYAKDQNGTLYRPAVTYTDSAGEEKAIDEKLIRAHYEDVGPSGEEGNADQGALVLVGTAANPIKIDGPVVVDSDVIIKGYVTGQGTIYSGRNVHIIGDLKYVNGPKWSHPDSDDETVEESNSQKDMLGLIAKGNIVIGDSSSDSWHNSVDSYIDGGRSSVVNSYACDASDRNIGYPDTFGGDYTAVEQVPSASMTSDQIANAVGGYDTSTCQFGKIRTQTVTLETTHQEAYYDWRGRYQGTREVNDTKKEDYVAYDRRYYETVCSDSVMQSLKDSAGIATVDAILYNNHAVMGTPGRSGYSFNLNGSLVCRDEALIFSGNGINFNWDMRLRRKSDNKMSSSLPPGPQPPFTFAWMLVADDLNENYKNNKKAGGSL